MTSRIAAFGLAVSLMLPVMAKSDASLPDGEMASGQRDIASAWLTGPSRIYGHGVLGDDVEATGIHVRMADGRELSFRLPGDSVFEDRKVRLADLDGDGNDELIVVRAYLDQGAALAVLRPFEDRIVVVAETEPIGQPYRWLNPAGVADFDGDGQMEVALVVTPHIGGILKIYQLRGGSLIQEWSSPGYSNHAIGSRNLDLALIVPDKGGPKLVLPDSARRGLREVRFDDGKYRARDLQVMTLGEITSMQLKNNDGEGGADVVYTTEDGATSVLRLTP